VTYLLTALLALATGWTWGHTTARIVYQPTGAHAEDDDDALTDDEWARFLAIADYLDPPDDPESRAA
jgi:hypothetical protein